MQTTIRSCVRSDSSLHELTRRRRISLTDLRSRIVKPTPTRKQSTLLVGPSGVGKTFQCGTLISGGWKTLIASTEQKLATIEALVPDVFPVKSFDFPKDITEKVPSDLKDLVEFLQTTEHGYDAVCVDSGMRFADELLKLMKKKHTGYELWGFYADKFEAAMSALTKLTSPESPVPVHVIVTMGVEMGMDWKGKRSWQPLLDGKKAAPRLPYLFDNVLVLMKRDNADKGGTDYAMYTAGTEEFDAKVASRVKVAPIISNPNLYELLKTLTGEK